jgi:dihydroanticapsin dehydrogenase
MCAQGGGSIVNISSIGGLTAFPRYAAYVASKGALNQLTRSIALDYGRFNVRANLVCPGAIDTPGNDPFIEAFYDGREAYLQAVARQAPLGRVGSPEDVAYAALYLASPQAAYVSGACIVVDGGRLAGG